MKIYILFLLLITSIFCYSQNEITNKKWLEIDKQGFIELNKFIDNKEFTFSNFKDKINNYQINSTTTSSTFHGAYMVSVLKNNGYTSFPITIGENGKIFYFKIFLDEYVTSIITHISENNEKIKSFLKKNWKKIEYKKEGIKYNGLVFEFYDRNRIKALYHLIDRYFGTKKIYVVENIKILEAYNKLLYPMNVYPFGNKCGINKVIPEGKKAIETLIKHNRFDLIKNVLKGYNAEGRAYAMKAIMEYKKIDDETMAVINKLRKSYLTLNDCYVCLIKKTTYNDLYLKLTSQLPHE